MSLQRTLKNSCSLEGVGLHSGKMTEIVLHPALPNHGIVFFRSDLENKPAIPALYKNVVNTRLATTLGQGEVTISTVEHVLAALQGLGVDNARIEVSGPEVPILDGSSYPFCEAMEQVGFQSQLQQRNYLILKKKIEIHLGEKWAVAEPASRLEIYGSIDWDHPAIGYQEYIYVEGQNHFRELSDSRTFGFLQDAQALKKMGLALGASLDNAVVLDHAAVLNPEGLRASNEFVKHKILDALGDFKLIGAEFQAKVRLHRSGHDLHHQLLLKIFGDPSCYEIVNAAAREEFVMELDPPVVRGIVAGF